MQATLPMPVQTATLAACNGNVKLVRNGQTIACEPGMQLLPGDRIEAGNSGHAEVQFTGVTEHVVIEHGSAATMALQTVQLDQPAQWVVTDLEGAHVFMEGQAQTDAQPPVQHAAEHASLQGLVADNANTTAPAPSDTGGHHWGEALLGFGAAAFVAADSGGSGSSTTADPTLSPAGSDASGSSAQPAPQPDPQPSPQPDPSTSNGNSGSGGNTSGGNLLTDLLHLQQSPSVSSAASHNPGLNDLLQGVLGQHKSA